MPLLPPVQPADAKPATRRPAPTAKSRAEQRLTPAGVRTAEIMAEQLRIQVRAMKALADDFAEVRSTLTPADAETLAPLISDAAGLYVAGAGRLDGLRSLIRRSAEQPATKTKPVKG